MPIFSREIEKTLRRSLSLANERKHEHATLEHLLLALTDDKDAREVLVACGCNVPSLQSTVRAYLNSELKDLVSEGDEEAKATDSFSESVQRAAFHVQSASKEEVTGSNVLVAIFAERASHAAFFLQEQGITRYDVINYTAHGIIKETALARVNSRIKEAAASAPQFKEKGGRLSYTERTAVGNLKQRKLAVAERLDCLRSICTARSNEQPQLSLLANRYSEALKRLRANSGSYDLFLVGLEIDSLVRLKSQSKPDHDRNIALDADQLFAIHSLMTAHAGLIVLFPDISNVTTEFDRYKELSTGAAQATGDVLNTALNILAETYDIFDEDTHVTLKKIAHLDDPEKEQQRGTKGWLRQNIRGSEVR